MTNETDEMTTTTDAPLPPGPSTDPIWNEEEYRTGIGVVAAVVGIYVCWLTIDADTARVLVLATIATVVTFALGVWRAPLLQYAIASAAVLGAGVIAEQAGQADSLLPAALACVVGVVVGTRGRLRRARMTRDA